MRNIIVEALAGTGKTFTISGGMHRVVGNAKPLKPSAEQQAIWELMDEYTGARKLCAAAYNVHIKNALSLALPKSVVCKTIHSFGLAAIQKFQGVRGTSSTIEENKTSILVQNKLGKTSWQIGRAYPGFLGNVKRLVALCKQTNLPFPTDKELIELSDHYNIEAVRGPTNSYKLVREILRDGLRNIDIIDFDDMPFVPVANKLPVQQFDLVAVDESQDLNKCQQDIVLRMSEHTIVVGDRHQAIYGFAGADTEAIQNLEKKLVARENGLATLPLTITRRCSHAVVEAAQEVVPEISAYPTNPEGKVDRGCIDWAEPGDMVLCRTNAPLISHAMRFLADGIPVEIIGRDIATGLTNIVEKLDADAISDLLLKLTTWEDEAIRSAVDRKAKAQVIDGIHDKADCIRALARGCQSISELVSTIDSLFSRERSGKLCFSTVHKAKGLEATNVYIICPWLMPHPLAKTNWELEQEMNLKYIAITRAKVNLFWDWQDS